MLATRAGGETMPRIEGANKLDLPPELHGLWDSFAGPYGGFGNQVRVLARSPDAFRHLYGLIDAWRRTGTLPQRLVEIAVVTASRVNACAYCVGHHGAALLGLGLSAETVERILEPRPPGMTDRELVVRDYARCVSERAYALPDEVFGRLRRHFDEREIVELTVRIGLAGLFNRFNQALQIEIEEGVPPGGMAPE
jgi:uncharacterized peroxidase-related enzyme